VATTRAQFTRPHSPNGDANAQRALCAGMGPIRSPALRAHLAARTRFVDDQVVAAIAAGLGQIVIVGAGYDDRALRFRSPAVRFFELDHPDTQADKRRRVSEVGADLTSLTFAPIDFRSDDVGDALDSVGHDPRRASLFICEGLLVYLDQSTIVTLLAALRSRATTDSTLAASLAIHPATIDSSAFIGTANARRPNGTTEPWQTILPAPPPPRPPAPGGLGADADTGRRHPGDRRHPRTIAAGDGDAGLGRRRHPAPMIRPIGAVQAGVVWNTGQHTSVRCWDSSSVWAYVTR
jgi:methyltransferase (TIGR00027 family)